MGGQTRPGTYIQKYIQSIYGHIYDISNFPFYQGGPLLSNACIVVALSLKVESWCNAALQGILKLNQECHPQGGGWWAEPRCLDIRRHLSFQLNLTCHARVSHSYDISNFPFYQGGPLLSNACIVVALSLKVESWCNAALQGILKLNQECHPQGGGWWAEPRCLDIRRHLSFQLNLTCHARVSHSYDISNFPFYQGGPLLSNACIVVALSLKVESWCNAALQGILKLNQECHPKPCSSKLL